MAHLLDRKFVLLFLMKEFYDIKYLSLPKMNLLLPLQMRFSVLNLIFVIYLELILH